MLISITLAGKPVSYSMLIFKQDVSMFQVLAHDCVSGPSVPTGALRAERRVLANGVLARPHRYSGLSARGAGAAARCRRCPG